MAKQIRLDKFLAEALELSRSDVKKMISSGKITIDGETVRRPETKLDPELQSAALNGEAIQPAAEFVYYLLHKPAGFVSATEDKRDRTVMELLPKSRRELFPAGRLDKDTEGLLLVTDDGALAHRLLSPKMHVDKTYYVVAEGKISEEAAERLRSGVDIGEKELTRPAGVEIAASETQISGGRERARQLRREKDITEILLTIHEGKFHQVKRMLEAVDSKVLYLRRITMGKMVLPTDLKPGEYIEIQKTEIE